MARAVAFLGSINVGGNRLKMADLTSALAAAGLAQVETVTASGNVLFDPQGRSAKEAEALIAETLADRFGLDVLVTVRSRDEVVSAIAQNPFQGEGEDRFVHTHFLEGQPTQVQFDRLVADHAERGSEKLSLGERMLFVDYVDGTGNSRLTGPFIERRLESRGTARNMRSLKRILEKMEA
tara:strand:- start:613 stop:1152 length:540 start_codon:yes stop_codon:yes gene_type:complete